MFASITYCKKKAVARVHVYVCLYGMLCVRRTSVGLVHDIVLAHVSFYISLSMFVGFVHCCARCWCSFACVGACQLVVFGVFGGAHVEQLFEASERMHN